MTLEELAQHLKEKTTRSIKEWIIETETHNAYKFITDSGEAA